MSERAVAPTSWTSWTANKKLIALVGPQFEKETRCISLATRGGSRMGPTNLVRFWWPSISISLVARLGSQMALKLDLSSGPSTT